VVAVIVDGGGGGAHIVPVAFSYPYSRSIIYKDINIIYDILGLLEILWAVLFIDFHDLLFLVILPLLGILCNVGSTIGV
jgi:hypothetical protein